MFCNNCGKAIDDKAVVCIHCGVATPFSSIQKEADLKNEKPNSGLMLLAFLVPIAGFIIGAIEKSNGKKKAGNAYIRMGAIAIVFYIVLSIVLYVAAIKSAEEAIDEAYENTNRYVSEYYEDTYEFASDYAGLFS